MTDLSKTVEPKSDQLNADDLIAGPITITITRLTEGTKDQPINVFFEGDNGKPYKPGKSMRRVMLRMWGKEGKAYAGRRLTLYRDDDVSYGGIKVGGIRISHMSDIDGESTFPLTDKRGSRKPYTVRPLFDRQTRREQPPGGGGKSDTAPQTLEQRVARFKERCLAASDAVSLSNIGSAAVGLRNDLIAADPDAAAELDRWFEERMGQLEAADRRDQDDDFPGDR